MKSQKCGMAESQALSKAFGQALSPYKPAVGNGTDKEREAYWREGGRKMLASALNLGVSQCYNWDEMMQMLIEAIDKAPCMRWMDPIHLAVSQVAAFRGAPHAPEPKSSCSAATPLPNPTGAGSLGRPKNSGRWSQAPRRLIAASKTKQQQRAFYWASMASFAFFGLLRAFRAAALHHTAK